MKQRSLLNGDMVSVLSRTGRDEAPWDATLAALADVATLMWDTHGKKWDCRVRNCAHFASAPTPVAAIEAARRLRDTPQPPRRRVLL